MAEMVDFVLQLIFELVGHLCDVLVWLGVHRAANTLL